MKEANTEAAVCRGERRVPSPFPLPPVAATRCSIWAVGSSLGSRRSPFQPVTQFKCRPPQTPGPFHAKRCFDLMVDAILGAYTVAPFDDCGGHVNLHVGYHYRAGAPGLNAILGCLSAEHGCASEDPTQPCDATARPPRPLIGNE